MEPLFSKYDVFSVKENQSQRLKEYIEKLSKDQIYSTSVDEWVNYCNQEFGVDVPKLKVDEVTAEVSDVQVENNYHNSDPFYRNNMREKSTISGTKISYYIPFTGDKTLFDIQPSFHNFSPPRGSIYGENLILIFTTIDTTNDQVKNNYERAKNEIEKHLLTLKNDFEPFNNSIEATVRAVFFKRLEKYKNDDGLAESLGVPLRKRDNAPQTYKVPDVRKKIEIPTPQTRIKDSHIPEPILDEKEYKNILNILKNMALVMEKSPSAFSHMGEENIRDNFLVQLNGQYEGRATGETFNVNGKTDIIIKENGKNIFIGECKIWRGPKTIPETIDQLLSYLSWRDTKTSILIFNRNKDFSAILDKIKSETIKHSCYKSTILENNEQAEFRYKFCFKSDELRLLDLTILVYNIPSVESVD